MYSKIFIKAPVITATATFFASSQYFFERRPNNYILQAEDDTSTNTIFITENNNNNVNNNINSSRHNNNIKYSSISYNANTPCEDTFSIVKNKNPNVPFQTACAVFDGHGGRQVAKYAEHHLLNHFKNSLLREVDNNNSNDNNNNDDDDNNRMIEKTILNTFKQIENDLRIKLRPVFELGFGSVGRVGACACVAILNYDNTLTIANAGDCRAVIGSIIPNNNDTNNRMKHIIDDDNNNDDDDTKPFQQQILNNKPDSKFNSIIALNDLDTNTTIQTNSPLDQNISIIAKPMTSIHNACVEKEKKQLQKDHPDETLEQLVRCKHPTSCYVKGRLQPTRSLGDFYLKYEEFNGTRPSKHNPYTTSDPNRSRHIKSPYNPPYIKATPEIVKYQINIANDKFLILATDGLWDELTPEEACVIVNDNIQNQGKDSIVETNAKVLLNAAMEKAAYRIGLTVDELKSSPFGKRRRSMHDDITIIVMEF